MKGLIYLSPHVSWLEYGLRSRYAFESNNERDINIEVIGNPTGNESLITTTLDKYSRAVVVDHAASLLSAEKLLNLTKKYPRHLFLLVIHSPFDHIAQWKISPYIARILTTIETTANLWYASTRLTDVYALKALGYTRILYFPYPIWLCPNTEPKKVDPPSIVLAGRIDWVKGQASQIMAMRLLQKKLGVSCCKIFIGGYVHGYDNPRSYVNDFINIAQLTCDFRDVLPYNVWIDTLKQETSVLLQCSFLESFNYTSIDAAMCGRPFVGSCAIEFTPDEWCAIPGDPFDIAKVCENILNNYEKESQRARKLAEAIALRNNQQHVTLIKILLADDISS